MNGTLDQKPLGRNEPPDRIHEEKYPFDAMPAEDVPTVPFPVIAGVAWYSNFDSPVQGEDGKWRVGGGDLGSIRGGHCFCLEQTGEPDSEHAWAWSDQKREGACEGFGNGRALSLIHNGTLFDDFWLYDDARRTEDRYPQGEGATNRGAGDALVKWGAHPAEAEGSQHGAVIHRVPWRAGVRAVAIKSFHWLQSMDELVKVLGYPAGTAEVPILNSWGKRGYPHRTYVPLDVLDRLKNEEGEYSVFATA
jgi:hypothetical protein